MTQSFQPPSKRSVLRGSWPRVVLLGLICTGLMVVLLTRDRHPSQLLTPRHPAIGMPAPQLDLIALANSTEIVRPSIVLNGRVTLIHFWGTWCPPCRAEYPHLSELTNELTHFAEFQFVPISCEGGRGETFEGLWQKTSLFFDSESIQSPAYADPRGVTRMSLADRFDQPSLYYPTSVLVGPDEKIAGVWEGYTETGIEEIAACVSRFIPEARTFCGQGSTEKSE